MLTVRKSQLDALEQGSMRRFEQQLTEHLLVSWPRECRLVGDGDRLLRAVREIIQVAQTNGYETSRELTLYAMLVFSLGIGFDTDPQLDWAASALFDESIESPTERIEALYDETVAYLGEIGGEDAERVVRALLRVRRYDFTAAPASEGEEQLEDLCDVLEAFWPEKLRFQEAGPTMAMLRGAVGKAAGYGIVCPMGRCVFATISYFFGHRFDCDPLHPWAAAVLADPTLAGEARARALRDAGLARVAQSLTRA